VEYTGLAFVSWPYGRIGTVMREDLVNVLQAMLTQWVPWSLETEATDVLKLKLAYEEPGPTNAFTWEQLGRVKAIIDCWVWESAWPQVSVIDDRPVRAQQVKARMAQVPLLLDTLEPLDIDCEGLSERLPIHAREALATLIR
jgi:hypothetical protein